MEYIQEPYWNHGLSTNAIFVPKACFVAHVADQADHQVVHKPIIMTSSNGNIFHVTGPLWGVSFSGLSSAPELSVK